MSIQTLVVAGDELATGTAGNTTYGFGGKGSWSQIVTDRLANLTGIGPLVSSGFLGTRSGQDSSFAYATTIAVRSAQASATTGAAPSIVMTMPTGVVDDDILVMMVSGYDTTLAIAAPTLPSGWTSLQTSGSGTASILTSLLCWRRASSEPASYTVNLSGSQNAAGTIIALSGANTSALVSAQSSINLTDPGGPTLTGAALGSWTAVDGIDLFFGAMKTSVAETPAPPAGYTQPANHTAATPAPVVTVDVAYKSLSAATTVGTLSATWSGFGGTNIAGHVFIYQASTSGWTDTLSTDAWDVSPYGTASSAGLLRYANGVANTATWTADADVRFPNVGFAIYYADYTGAGTWSYSTNGGSSWTNIPDAPHNDNKIAKFYVATPITRGGTITIRAANAAGTGQGCAPLGVEIFYQNPATASGLVVHNLAVSSATLHALTTATSGDRLAFFKSSKVRLGTNAISHIPTLGTVLLHVEDSATANTPNVVTWNADLNTFDAIVGPLGPVVVVSPYEIATATATAVNQANYRAQTKTTAAAWSTAGKVLDIYDLLAAAGINSNAQMSSAGLLYSDAINESQAGHLWVADKVYWYLRTQLTTVAQNVNAFTLASSGLGTHLSLGGTPGGSAAADSAGGTDAITGIRGAIRTAADSAGGTDVVTRASQSFIRTTSDTLGGTDVALNSAHANIRTIADTAGGTDLLGYILHTGSGTVVRASLAASDTAGGTDVATRSAISFSRSASDTAGGSDAGGRALVFARTASDTGGGTDAASRAFVTSRSASDAAAGTDTATVLSMFIRSASDTAGGTDSLARSPQFIRTASDAAGGTDVVTRVVTRSRDAADAAGGTDVASGARPLVRASADTAGGTDSATRILSRLSTAADNAGGTDVATGRPGLVRSASDTAGGTDAVTRVSSRSRSSADTAGGTDSLTRFVATARSASDTASGTDSATPSQRIYARAISDTAGGTDAVTRGLARVLADTAGGTDAATRHLVVARSSADTAGGTDAASGHVGTNAICTASDTAGGTDAATRARNLPRTASDTAGGVEAVLLRLTRTATDIAGGTDSVGVPTDDGTGIRRIRVTFRNDQRSTFETDGRVTFRLGRRTA